MKSPNPSAPPLPVANSAHPARAARNTVCIPPGHAGSLPTRSAQIHYKQTVRLKDSVGAAFRFHE